MAQLITTYLIPILTFLFGVGSFWGAYIRKRYAAQRDFAELHRNYLEMSKELQQMRELIDRRIDHQERILIEIKSVLYLRCRDDL